VFLEMGFEEMPTSRFVESSFWNFDSLFQPQQHPARDALDTFFLEQPACSQKIPKDYMEKVRHVHQTGGYGSTGYQYEWSEEETRKNILRTHTTAVSSRMLYAAAQDAMKTGEFQPRKYFSIDRVFRNENLDKTHLAEFHQIEGLVMDRNLCLGDLMGVIAEYFVRIGMVSAREETKFKPAYNPYTEPSMEIFGYHPDLKCLIEVGNSGMFRPEMLQPIGLPEDVSVIAWGLSLERPTMIKYGIRNIRDLFGSGVNLDFIRRNPICRFDNQEPAPEEEEQEAVRGSSTHVDLNNLQECSGGLSAEELAAMRAKTKSAAEFAKDLTPEQQAEYGIKPGIAASAVREDSDGSDDDGADFQMGGPGDSVMLGDY
jgi:phenylalanyl-tRNA synthetase alpha chain